MKLQASPLVCNTEGKLGPKILLGPATPGRHYADDVYGCCPCALHRYQKICGGRIKAAAPGRRRSIELFRRRVLPSDYFLEPPPYTHIPSNSHIHHGVHTLHVGYVNIEPIWTLNLI
jgi:hypothetical protein